MESHEIINAGAARSALPPWSPAQMRLFRLAFSYLALYLVPLYLNALPVPDLLTAPWRGFWNWLVPKVGKATFGVDASWHLSGSGDTSYDWVLHFCFVVLALAATLVWTLLDRRRGDYRRLYLWLHVGVRFGLAATMISYGAYKLIPAQFGPPSLDRLLQPFGDASPMGLLWTFMGASGPYTSFTGGIEILGGLLLSCRRTTLAGALVTLGAMAQVAALNLCYDVPVKLLSLHMVVLSIGLAAPHWRRLAGFFVRNTSTQAAPLPALFTRPKWHRGALALRTVWVVAVTSFTLVQAQVSRSTDEGISARSPLRGIWEVEELETDGQPRPPLTTDASRWRRWVFDYPQMATLTRMNDVSHRLWVKLDEEKRTMEITTGRIPDFGTALLSYEQPEPDLLLLSGSFEKQQVKARLVRRANREFLLQSRGFHWVSEYPFNR